MSIPIETHDDHVLSIAIDGAAHELHKAATEKLGLVDDNRRSFRKFGPRKGIHESIHGYSQRGHLDTIMIDNRHDTGLVAIINIGGQDQDLFVETAVAPHDALNLGGLASKHGSYNDTEAHCSRGCEFAGALQIWLPPRTGKRKCQS
jgi:hypothetical protein